jgi:hypothetical protein
MRYVDAGDAIRIYRGTAAAPSLSIPKDKRSDSYRFAEALQEKIQEVCGGLAFAGAFLVPLKTRDNVQPADWLAFRKGWDEKEITDTTAIWRYCFQTNAWEHKENGVFVELDLLDEHYYNVVVLPSEEHGFCEMNPLFVKKKCVDGNCIRKVRGEVGDERHAHYVHGAYAGSRVNGKNCAPPFRLTKYWQNAVEFTVIGLIEALTNPHKHAAREEGNPVMALYTRSQGSGCGALALANLVERKDDVVFQELRELFRDPHTAAWGSFEACDERQLEKIRDQQRKLLKNIKLLGKLRSLALVLQHLWDADKTTAKVVALSTLREYVADDQVQATFEGDMGPSAQ